MPKIAGIAAAAALSAVVFASAAEAGPYGRERFVEAVVADRITEVLQHRDGAVRLQNAAYLAGFSLWYDSRCDFLPMPVYEAVKQMVVDANGGPGGTAEAAALGLRDAKAFLGEAGCATREARSARQSLTRFWHSAVQGLAGERSADSRAPRASTRDRL